MRIFRKYLQIGSGKMTSFVLEWSYSQMNYYIRYEAKKAEDNYSVMMGDNPGPFGG